MECFIEKDIKIHLQIWLNKQYVCLLWSNGANRLRQIVSAQQS